MARESDLGWRTHQTVFGNDDALDSGNSLKFTISMFLVLGVCQIFPGERSRSCQMKKKHEKIKQAEREVKFSMTNRRFLKNKNFGSNLTDVKPGLVVGVKWSVTLREITGFRQTGSSRSQDLPRGSSKGRGTRVRGISLG